MSYLRGNRGSIATTAVGYAGHDPAVLLAMAAMGAFGEGSHATAGFSGDRLIVGVGSYTLICRRVGAATA